MTEPPQPPNQPPTPSGYGHLPGPPQQGYGYPPQGGANPYAQQPQTVPQPLAQHGRGHLPGVAGGGYPPPPGMPPGPPPGAPGAPGRRKALIAVAASVAGVLVLGTGAYFAFAGDEGGNDPKPPVAQSSTPADAKPSGSPSVDKGDGSGNGSGEQTDLNAGRKQGEDKVLWLKTAKMDGPGAGIITEGQWVVGDTVVKTIDKSVVGYAVTDGKEKWKLDVGAEICGLTDQTTADGKTVIVVQDASGSDCNQMKLIDLKAGTAGWTKEVAKEGLFDSSVDVSPTISGDTVAINRLTKSTAYRISTGEKLFSGSGPEGCQPSAYAGGNGKMLAIATCHDANFTVEVQDADPVTGKKTWAYPLPKGWRVNSVYSVDPIVLDIGNRDTKERAVISLGPDGKKRSSMAAEGSFQVNCGSTSNDNLQGCGTSAVDGNTLYLTTAKDDGGFNNEIVAFDIATGKAKWRTPAGDKKLLAPLRAANGTLIAYRTGSLDQPGEIISIPAGGGSPTVLLRHPSGPAADIENSFMFAETDYVDGRFFMSVSRLAAQGKDEKLLMVFGK